MALEYKIVYDGSPFWNYPYMLQAPYGTRIRWYMFLWTAKRGLRKHKRGLVVVYREEVEDNRKEI